MALRLVNQCTVCHHHGFSEPIPLLDSFSCLHCGLRYKRETQEPIGWIVKVEGHSGGLVPYDLLAPFLPPETEASAVAGFLVSAVSVALTNLPQLVQETDREIDEKSSASL